MWCESGTALARRRLSIIDLAGGPSADGVGERQRPRVQRLDRQLPALRKDLHRSGWSFRTGSDTQVVLTLHELHGIEGIRRLEGNERWSPDGGPVR
jgi:asparagine synthetase B (glutamine-hydrolysing)